MATKQYRVKWTTIVEEHYEATIEVNENDLDEYEYDLESYVLLEKLPGAETKEHLVPTTLVSDREVDELKEEGSDNG